MKCSSCGAEFTGAFCPYCGSKAAEAAPSAPVQNNNVYANAQQSPVNPSQTAPAQTGAFAHAGQENPAGGVYQPVTPGADMYSSQKKKKKAPMIIGIIIAVIALIAILGLCFANSIVRSIAGETGFYLLNETETVKELLDLDLEKLQKNEKMSSNTTISVKSSKEIPEKLQEVLSKLTIYSAVDKKSGQVMLDAKGNFSGKDAEIKACMNNEAMGITAPGLMDSALYMDTSSAFSYANEEQLNKIVKKLTPIVKEVEKEELANIITVDKHKVNGKNCRVVTYAFTEKTALNALAALTEKIMDDEDLMKIIEEILKTAYDSTYSGYANNPYYTPPTFDEFLKQFKELPKQLRERANRADSDETLNFSIAYKGSRILQRKIEIGEMKVTIDTDTSGSEKTLSVDYSQNGKHQEILSYTRDSKDLSLKVMDGDKEMFTLTVNDYKVKKINGVYAPVFSMNLSIYDDYTVKADATDNDTYDLSVQVNDADGNEKVSFTLSNELSSKPDFSEYTEPDKNASTDMNEFIRKLQSELYDVIEGSSSNNNSYSNYGSAYNYAY